MSSERVIWLEDEPERAITKAREAVLAGGVVLFPTDTVYGLMCSHCSKKAYERIFQIKQRPAGKPLQLLLTQDSHLFEGAMQAVAGWQDVRQGFYAGGVTLIIETRLLAGLPPGIAQLQPGPVGLRCPAYHHLQDLLASLGDASPLFATSANPTGQPPLTDADAVRHWLKDEPLDLEVAVVSRRELGGRASEVWQMSCGQLLKRR